MCDVVRVGGVDGCPGGWVVASVEVGPAGPTVAAAELEVVADAAALVALVTSGAVETLAVDIPIGLPEEGPRRCDREARALLGPRRASVFPAPARRSLSSHRFEDVQGMSIQTFNLLPKIADVDHHMTPALGRAIVESHPELAFSRLGSGPMSHPKRTAEGRAQRCVVLGLATGRIPRPHGTRPDDVLDALSLVHTAWRLHIGEAERLGGELDVRGLRMEIAW